MLWVNLIMDTLASLALATEQPNWMLLLSRAPYSRKEGIVSFIMFKHMMGQAVFQITILLFLVFRGEFYLPEYRADQSQNGNHYFLMCLGLVISGRLYYISSSDKDYEGDEPSMHFTYIFNIFVFLQIFNFLNARKLNDELNIFEGLQRSKLFVVIVILIIVLQVLLVTFGYRVVNVYMWGLSWKGWILTIVVSSLGLVVSFLLKVIPLIFRCCCWTFSKGTVEKPMNNSFSDENGDMKEGAGNEEDDGYESEYTEIEVEEEVEEEVEVEEDEEEEEQSPK